MTEDNRSDQRIEQRRASRHPLAFDIQIRNKGRRHLPATLTSISRFGCSVVGAALPKSDDLVWVRIPGLESQAAELRWSDQARAGLAFLHPLHVAVADRFRERDAELERARPQFPC